MFVISLIAAFIVAILSGLGVGGGGLFVIYLALFTDIPQLQIQGINLAFFLFSSTASLLVHLTKRKILWSAVAIMSASGIVGTIFGSMLSIGIDGDVLKKIFGAMLIVSGILSLKNSFRNTLKKQKNKP